MKLLFKSCYFILYLVKIFKSLAVTHILLLYFVNMSKNIILTCMIPPAKYKIVFYLIVFFNLLFILNIYS